MKGEETLKKGHFSICLILLLILLVSLNFGCTLQNQMRSKIPDLASVPFDMPDRFPMPDDAQVIHRSKPLKGGEGEILFRSNISYKDLIDFYRKKMIAYGLTEDPDFYKLSEDSFNLTFVGWPGGKNLSINASSRSISGRLWSKREPIKLPPAPEFNPVKIRPLFKIPDEVPVPEGAEQVTRNDFGHVSVVEFYTKMSIDEILTYYRKTFHLYVIKEDASVSDRRIDSLSMRFLGFPDNRWLGMSVEDIAYSGEQDIRRVVFNYKGVRRPKAEKKMKEKRRDLTELFTPVEGVSLKKWAVIKARSVYGENEDNILKEERIKKTSWEKAETTWEERMKQSKSMRLTAAYSQFFFDAGIGKYPEAGHDIARALAENTKLTGDPPIPMEKWIEISQATTVGMQEGKKNDEILKMFDMNPYDWSVVSNWWGKAMLERSMYDS